MVDWFLNIWLWIQTNWAGVVATSAMTIALWQFYQQRIHDRLSVKPVIAFGLLANADGISFTITNKGLGPSLNKEIHVFVNGFEQVDNWTWEHVLEQLQPNTFKLLVKRSIPACIPAGESVTLCTFTGVSEMRIDEAQRTFAFGVQAQLKYSSMYREKAVTAHFDIRNRYDSSIPATPLP